MRHFIIIGVLVAILTVATSALLTSANLLPVEASLQAGIIDQLFNTHFTLISFLFSLIVVFIGYSLVVFRRKPGDTSEGKYIKGNTRLEIFWTIIPLGIVLYLSYLGALSLGDIRRVDPQALEVKVTAFQWSWTFEYPAYGFTTNTLYLPVDRQVLLKMTSRDVIHSFWVPEFRVKQDILPGQNLVKDLRLTPTELGTYTLRCAELCGGAHAYMERPVVVVSKEDFDKWVNERMKEAVSDPVERGKRQAEVLGCTSCHSIDGKTVVGPTWKGVFGTQIELADGSSVSVDEAYLKNAIINPNVQVRKGFQANVMPSTYAKDLSEQQIVDMINYIQSLK